MSSPWLVLRLPDSHARLGSFPLRMLEDAKEMFNMQHIQTDVNGCQHWVVFSEKRKRRGCEKIHTKASR